MRLRLYPTGNGVPLYYQGTDLTMALVDPEKDEGRVEEGELKGTEALVLGNRPGLPTPRKNRKESTARIKSIPNRKARRGTQQDPSMEEHEEQEEQYTGSDSYSRYAKEGKKSRRSSSSHASSSSSSSSLSSNVDRRNSSQFFTFPSWIFNSFTKAATTSDLLVVAFFLATLEAAFSSNTLYIFS